MSHKDEAEKLYEQSAIQPDAASMQAVSQAAITQAILALVDAQEAANELKREAIVAEHDAEVRADERRRVAEAIRGQMPEAGSQICMTPYREGLAAGMSRCLQIAERSGK